MKAKRSQYCDDDKPVVICPYCGFQSTLHGITVHCSKVHVEQMADEGAVTLEGDDD